MSSAQVTATTSTVVTDKSILNSQMRTAIDELQYLSPLYRQGSLTLLHKILSSIIESPNEAKYRRINADKLRPRIRCSAGMKLLEVCGFKHALNEVIKQQPEEEAFMTMSSPPTDEKLAQMKEICKQLDEIIQRTKKSDDEQTSTPEGVAATVAGSSSMVSSSTSSSSTTSTKPRGQAPEEGDTIEDDKFVFFWHSPSFCAQWTMVPFVIDGVKYICPEQWMMASKAKLFGDHKVFAEIMTCASARQHKQLGRKVANFKADVWDRECFDIVVKGNYAKFSQHPLFAKRLLATGNKIIAEASPLDCVWGIGLAANAPDARSPDKWNGTNLLGKAIMKVREQLREEQANQGLYQ